MSDRCLINYCDRQIGAGTQMRVRAVLDVAGSEPERIVPVCEEHWQAIRSVRYLSEVAQAARVSG